MSVREKDGTRSERAGQKQLRNCHFTTFYLTRNPPAYAVDGRGLTHGSILGRAVKWAAQVRVASGYNFLRKTRLSIFLTFSMQIASSLFLFFFLEKLILAVQKTITEDISPNTSGSPTPAKQGTCLHRVLYWKRRNICYVRRHLLMWHCKSPAAELHISSALTPNEPSVINIITAHLKWVNNL